MPFFHFLGVLYGIIMIQPSEIEVKQNFYTIIFIVYMKIGV